MFFATLCAGCNQPGSTLCNRCRFSLASAPSRVSETGITAALPFEGVARQVVHGLKYRNRRAVARQLARLMVGRVRVGKVDVVTWAPTSSARARQRGYSGGEEASPGCGWGADAMACGGAGRSGRAVCRTAPSTRSSASCTRVRTALPVPAFGV